MNCEQTLGYPDISFMRRILFLQMQMQGKKRSKVGHLARLFNAADAFSGTKYTHKSKCQDTPGSVHNSSASKILSAKARLQGEKRSKVGHLASIFNAAGAFLSQKIATR